MTNDSMYGGTSYTKVDISAKKTETSMTNWGESHPMKSEIVKDRLKATMMATYGVDNPSKAPEVIEKIRAVSLERYGVDNPSKVPEVIEKIRKAAQTRWDDPIKKKSMLDKRKATNLARYGVEFSSQRPEHMVMLKKTCMKKYGTEWPMQNDEIHDRSARNSFLTKTYTFPSGRIESIQGYEGWAIDMMLHVYHEDDLIITRGKKPRILYNMNNKVSHYKPDIFIPKDNLLIEVKSTFTYTKELERNLMKKKASEDAGYTFKFMVFDSKGKLHDNY